MNRTPIEEDCFRQGRETAQRGEPMRQHYSRSWGSSMINAYQDGYRAGLAPKDLDRMERIAAYAQRCAAPSDETAELFPS